MEQNVTQYQGRSEDTTYSKNTADHRFSKRDYLKNLVQIKLYVSSTKKIFRNFALSSKFALHQSSSNSEKPFFIGGTLIF